MTFIVTRINVGDYDIWKPMFDQDGPGARKTAKGVLLVENHCPICAAAKACQQFCRSELRVFQEALGDDVTVERVDHILAGARRCAYLVCPRRPGARSER